MQGLIPLFLACALCLLGLVGSGSVYFYREKIGMKAALFLGLLFFFACGLAIGAGALRTGEYDLGKYLNQDVQISGTIIPGTLNQRDDGSIGLQLACDLLKTGTTTVPAEGIIRLSISKLPANSNIKSLAYGRLNVQGKLLPITGFANPGVFDTELMAKIQGIRGRITVRAGEVQYVETPKPWRAYLAEVGTKMRQQLDKFMPKKDAAVLAGMTLGGYDGIEDETVRSFSTTGIVHILSVSGSHIALLIGFILSVMNGLRVQEKYSLCVAAASIVGYSLICGFSPPVLRSVLMGIAMLVGLYMQKNEDRGAVLTGVVIVMLCYRPRWLLDIGFQLSFMSTAGLIYLFPQLEMLLLERLPKFVAAALAVTIAAQLAVLPLLVYYFHQLSLSSLAANLVVVPLLEFIVVLTLFGLMVSFLILPAGVFMLLAASLLLGPALRMTELIASWPLAAITIARTPVFMAAVYYLFLWALFRFWPLTNLEEKERKFVLLFTSLAMMITVLTTTFRPQPFTVYFIDVGQGDSALIITPEKKTILLDTGGLRGDYNTGERILVPFLRYLGIKRLDVLALSHGHHDHAGGAARLAQLVPIDEVLLPREEPSEDIEQLLHVVQGCSKIKRISSGEKFMLGKCQFDIIQAPEAIDAETTGNESSAIVRVTVDGRSLVFTGDATEEEELAAAVSNIRADVLKVSHHGSKTSSTPVFLSAVQPRLAVISVGANNHFGHPAPETLANLQATRAQVLRTDQLGNIKVVFDGSNCAWYSYRYQDKYF